MSTASGSTEYDDIIDDYMANIERPDSWNNLYERPHMLSLLPPLNGRNVLDIGCGTGFYTEYALDTGASVTAVDISRTMLDVLANRISSPRLKIIQADMTRPMPFLDTDSFDCVICSLAIHYLDDWTSLLAELYRVLRRGGNVVISTHHPFDDYATLKKKSYFDKSFVEDTWGKSIGRPFKVHYYTRSLDEVLRPVIESPFRITGIEEPLPTEQCRETYPELYRRLSELPAFLFITLEK